LTVNRLLSKWDDKVRMRIRPDLDRDEVGLKQFCFSDGEAIRQEGVECPMWFIGRGGRRSGRLASGKPFGPGEFEPNPSVFGLARCTTSGYAEALDLGPNSTRQNDSIQPHLGLNR